MIIFYYYSLLFFLIITLTSFFQMGLLQAAMLLFGNEFLFQSILFSLLLSSIIVVSTCEARVPYFSVRGILVATAVSGLTLTLKTKISQFYGDHDVSCFCMNYFCKIFKKKKLYFQAHIFDILRAKLTNFKSFHTLLYTCSAEFDFLPISTIDELTKTCLIPTVAAVIGLVFYRWVKNFFQWRQKTLESDKLVEPDVLYNVLQLGAFTIMAVFIMRLKLFWTPHLCLMASLIMSSKVRRESLILKKCKNTKLFFQYLPSKNNMRYSLLALLIAAMSYHGVTNIIKQRNIIGKYMAVIFFLVYYF